MDHATRRGLMGLSLMVTVCVAVIMVMWVEVPPQKKRHLILDAPGCEGVRQLGLTPSPIDRGGCEMEAKAAIGSTWIKIGNVKIHTDRLIAMRDAE